MGRWATVVVLSIALFSAWSAPAHGSCAGSAPIVTSGSAQAAPGWFDPFTPDAGVVASNAHPCP